MLSGNIELRILVAEDNTINQAVIRGMLEYAGHQVDAVDDGEKAISALKANRYDLVIMDCMMPVMDGFSATCAIRSAAPEEFDPDIPVLAITALATADDRRRCLEAGMTGYLSKPVIAKDLFAWIDSHFSASSRSRGINAPDSKCGEESISPAHLIRKMIPMLVRDAEQWRQDLRAHCDNGRMNDLGALAHKIRGTADVLGERSLSGLAKDLEIMARGGETNGVPGLTARLSESLDRMVRKIRDSE